MEERRAFGRPVGRRVDAAGTTDGGTPPMPTPLGRTILYWRWQARLNQGETKVIMARSRLDEFTPETRSTVEVAQFR